MLEQVREALPSAEELEKLSAETDPEEFLNELRQVSEQMAALERGPTPQRAPGEPPGVSFAKAGFLAERKGPTPAGSSAGPPPSRVPEYRLAEEGEPARALQLTVKLPGIGQIADLELDISSTLVRARARAARTAVPRRSAGCPAAASLSPTASLLPSAARRRR